MRSREPVWDQPELRAGPQPYESGGFALEEGHATLSTSLLDGTPQAVVHMPHATAWPAALALGILVLAYGLLFGAYVVAIVGLIATAVGILGWFWPRGETQET